MNRVQQLATSMLDRDPAIELIAYRKEWITVGAIKQLSQQINQLINASSDETLSPVAFVPRNRPECLSAMLGLAAGGRYLRMIHPYQSPEGIARDVQRLKPAIMLALLEDFSEQVLQVLEQLGIAAIALDNMTASVVEGFEHSRAECDPLPTEPMFDLLTSGTTGPPKQFPITYDFIADEMLSGSPMSGGIGLDPLALAPAYLFWPFGNFSGLYSTLTPMLLGMRGFLADRFSVAECHDYLLCFRPSMIGLPPAGIQMILDADIPVEDFSSLKTVNVGSAPLPVSSQRGFEEKYGIPILQAYGATEFGGPVAMMTPDLAAEWGIKKRGSVGRPYRGAKLRTVDPETGEQLASAQEGLLEVISPRMGSHWIRTSDLGIIDEDGFLWHRGRADGAIMRGGFKLLPETIERALLLHGSVAAVMVTGIADRRLGQVPAAGIVLKPGARTPPIEELESHLRREIEATHIPVVWRYMAKLPYNAMMKPDRIQLRKMFESTEI